MALITHISAPMVTNRLDLQKRTSVFSAPVTVRRPGRLQIVSNYELGDSGIVALTAEYHSTKVSTPSHDETPNCERPYKSTASAALALNANLSSPRP